MFSGGALKPFVTTLNTEDGLMLLCEVLDVSPRTKVELQDASGNILPARDPQLTDRGGSFDIKLLAAVTKTDNFRCVVTLEDGSHLVSADLYVNGEFLLLLLFKSTNDSSSVTLTCDQIKLKSN